MPERKSPGQSVEITISWATLFKILAACVLALMAMRLWPSTIVERIWLRAHLEDDTVARHEELEEKEHPGG